ncbi:cupin domain-containing protein [Niabella beijingensis]|uniref:cupin domain-containing protein n=1 Tax=Niabella beijingensis TaxID=2872700 RepID=UPI001CBCB75D|nr:cupin domain-containing protein [Niabella beijingensis]MBZ4191052.1 cupin domain-containing protein [Niabella beijingensis]
MKGFHTNIENDTRANAAFRKVLYTGRQLQLVLMTLQPGEEIGAEVHPENDQFFRFEEGSGRCLIDDTEYTVSDGSAVVIPAGSRHNVINTGSTELKMYTIYAPPHHKDGIVRNTKKEAEENEEEYDGNPTEQS